MSDMIEFEGKLYNGRNGAPFDRGAADSYYRRGVYPHYYTGKTYQSQEILLEPGTPAYDEYMAGFQWNERFGGKKEY